MKIRGKIKSALAGVVLVLMMVSVTACSHSNPPADSKTPADANAPASPKGALSPDEQVKQHRQQQGGQTGASTGTSGTSSGQ